VADEYGAYRHATPTNPGLVVRGGCIRFDTATPRLHTNTGHQSFGLLPDTLAVVSGLLYVDFDVSLPVIACTAAADETLVARGINAGISGAVGAVNIRFALAGHGPLNLNNPADYDRLRGANANVWLHVASWRAP
jgi:hypothetical protein